MALPTIILRNTTGADIDLVQLAATVPAAGSFTISDVDFTFEVLSDPQLISLIDSGDIEATLDGAVLTSEQTKAQIRPLHALDLKHNLSAVLPPLVSDDKTTGYSVGSNWIDTATAVAYRCFADTAGAAVWKAIGGAGGQPGPAVLAFGAETIPASTADRWLFPWGGRDLAVLSELQMAVPRSGTIRNMFVFVQSPSGSPTLLTYTVLKNSVDTALVVVMAASAPGGSNTSDSFAVVAGDLISLRVTKPAPAGTPDDVIVMMSFDG